MLAQVCALATSPHAHRDMRMASRYAVAHALEVVKPFGVVVYQVVNKLFGSLNAGQMVWLRFYRKCRHVIRVILPGHRWGMDSGGWRRRGASYCFT